MSKSTFTNIKGHVQRELCVSSKGICDKGNCKCYLLRGEEDLCAPCHTGPTYTGMGCGAGQTSSLKEGGGRREDVYSLEYLMKLRPPCVTRPAAPNPPVQLVHKQAHAF